MAGLKITDKAGLGRLVLTAAANPALRDQLLKDPAGMLKPFLESLPPGHKIEVVAEDENASILVLPSAKDLPKDLKDMESILREEAREYDQAKQEVEDSKKTTGNGSIPAAVVEEKYALMVGHTALSPSSRPGGQTRLRPVRN